jgi:hypothetical protein
MVALVLGWNRNTTGYGEGMKSKSAFRATGLQRTSTAAADNVRSLPPKNGLDISPGLSRSGEHPDILREESARRAMRAKFLPVEITRGVVWEIITDVYLANISGERISLSCIAMDSLAPRSTIMRQVNVLVLKGYLIKEPDPEDRRRFWVSTSAAVREGVSAYLQNLDRSARSVPRAQNVKQLAS